MALPKGFRMSDTGMVKTHEQRHEGLIEDSYDKSRPTISFDSEELPEIEKWEVGKNYNIMLEVKQKELSDKGNLSKAEFEITKVKAV